MNQETQNFAPDPCFVEFAARCNQLGTVVAQCNADGSHTCACPEFDPAILEFLLSRPEHANALQQLQSTRNGESTLISILPGIEYAAITSAHRNSEQSYLITLFIDKEFPDWAALEPWVEFPPAIRKAFLKLHNRSGGTTHIERQRLATVLGWWYTDLNQNNAQDVELGNLSLELGDSYEITSLLLRIGECVNVTEQPIEFVKMVCDELREAVGFRWVGTRILPGLLEHKSLAGGLICAGDSPLSQQALLQQTTEILVTREMDTAVVLDTHTDPALADFKELGHHILAHPIRRGERLVGGIFACDMIDENEQIDWGDIRVIEAGASHLQIFLDNAALYEDVQLMFIGTLDALTASIDAKDPYTCGHSRRVAHMSRELAQAMGLDPATVERVHIAGLVHDVGKIGVAESVLRKPGRLTDDEFEMIKRHPDIGARILRDIPQFEDVIPGVLYHHERYDGKGYPRGLKGDDIPLFGRILAVADSFDAMSSTRQYRKALPRATVLREMQDCAGTQFDPELIPIFLALDFTAYDRLAEEHRALASNNDSREAA